MPEISPSRFLVQCAWSDVPHIAEKDKEEILSSTLPYLRDARSKGIPTLGAGAIYPIPEEEIVVAPFPIPKYWPRVYGLDVGWKKTAALWLAHDRDNDIAYAYTEHYRGEAEPPVHATAIKARGTWMTGCIDPASRGRSQKDGEQLIVLYRAEGLHIVPAINAVEAGLHAVYERLVTGRLKLFSTLQNTRAEYRLYRRHGEDETVGKVGKPVKEFDHAMDALRYGIMGLSHAKCAPAPAHNAALSVIDQRAGY